MSIYLENFKWIISGQKEESLNNKINIQTDNLEEHNSVNNSESDSDYDYDKIISKDITNSHDFTSNVNHVNQTLKSIQEDYNKIHKNLIQKERLVRNRVNSDTVEKIKENYSEFINDDIQIIKDFAIIMETFEHIKDKLKDFETGIKEFEEDIKKNTINQDENKQELDNKINHIDLRLENTIKLMDQIKSNGDEFIKKIIHLENLIKTHDEHREQILLRLEKFDKDHKEIKNINLRVLNFFHDYQNYWTFSRYNINNLFYSNNYFRYIGLSIGICSAVIFGYKFMKNK